MQWIDCIDVLEAMEVCVCRVDGADSVFAHQCHGAKIEEQVAGDVGGGCR